MPPPLRTLKDGYWDRTTVVRAADGSLRVRKESKQTDSPGPWALAALRREISYLTSLHGKLAPHFPPVLDRWDHETVGYELPFYHDRHDLSSLVLEGTMEQSAADEMQQQLAVAILEGVHRTKPPPGPDFSSHLEQVLSESLSALAAEKRFRPLIESQEILVNGQPVPGLASSLQTLRDQGLLDRLQDAGTVLLHGDLILENILWPPLLLIDPVSVAGLDSGPPLFDLVKYESFATGELYAIREELVTAGPSGDEYRFEWPGRHPALDHFRTLDLCSSFRAAYQREHGEIDSKLYALIDAYFSLVMARNTTGLQQWARVIKGCRDLAEAAAD